MFEYRKALPGERCKYLDFANMVFSMAHRPHDFAALLPKVYGEGKPTEDMQYIAVDESGGIRGLVAALPGKFEVMGEILNTAYIGTVSTHPRARGEGHMKTLMNMVMDEQAKNGCDIAMLGGQRQRYEYFGFTRGGVAREYSVNHVNVRHALKDVDEREIAFVELSAAEHVRQAAALYAERSAHALRSEADFVEICKSWFGMPYAILKSGEFAGYMVALGDTICEIGLCDYEDLFASIKGFMNFSGNKGLKFLCSDYDYELNAALAEIAESTNLFMAQQIKIFSFKKVVGAYMRLKAEYYDIADGEACFDVDGEVFTIKVKNGEVEVSDAPLEDMIWRLSAMSAQRLFFDIDGRITIGELPLGWAPLPLYYFKPDEF